MAILLDLQRPVVVITGMFNPAIFNPPWMAINLFGVPIGETVNIVVVEGLGSGGSTTFLRPVGVSVGPTRLELFSATNEAESFAKVEEIAKRIVEVLPHTPFGAVGTNFGFVDAEPPDQIEPLFATGEKLEEQFPVNERTLKTKLAPDADSVVNIERTLGDEGFFLAINHHFPDLNPGNAEELLAGRVQQDYERAVELCKTLYGYEDIGTQTLPFPET